jgi:sugar diacid utilization regulator
MENSNQLSQICKLPGAASLQQLCDLTYQITGNPAFVSDMAHTILAYTRCVEVSDSSWQSNVVSAVLDKNTLVQAREVGIVHESSTGNRRPVLVQDGAMPYHRLIKTLVVRGIPVGVMVLTAYFHPFHDQDENLVELISSFMLPMMEKHRYYISSNQKTVENYFIQLLDGVTYSSERVEKRLQVLEFQRTEYMYVLAICAGRRTAEGENRSIAELIEELHRLNCGHAFLYGTTLVCIYCSDHDITDWDTQEEGLTSLLHREELYAGVSRRIIGMEDLRAYYLQARDVLEIGLKLDRDKTHYYRYDSLSSFLLFQNIPREELGRYCHQKIQKLGEYDKAHNMELCATLEVYLEQAKSLAKAAEVLFIHRNTVRYRINKCMELMNTDLEDGNEIFAYILSLRILEYDKKFPMKHDGRTDRAEE